ncbi:hypothetical protein [Nostoc sp. FACHB-110]|uniref:hypothetical protein n=1 Tax=Nostoc sp. FACHB-110 TaxID=2692834 RepID=UPI001683D2CC|nr:hypothetical protein [Nostoc sp. FACHB-110]MBD2437093.1 hypothetical protein [Nostoc sp. FACHB-110]
MDFLDDFFNFIGNAWDEFSYWLDSVISKIIDSVTGWIKSIHNLIKRNDIIVSTGPESFRVSQNALQDELKKNNVQVQEMNDSNKAAILDQLVLSAKRENEHSVPLTLNERDKWQNYTYNKAKMYVVTNK